MPLERAKKQAKDAFVIFEHREGSKNIDMKEVPNAIRAVGINPTQQQVKMLHEQLILLSPEDSSHCSLDHFEMIVGKFLAEQEAALFRDDYHTLLRAFRAFDTEGKGYIEAESLKASLTSKGEPFSQDEMLNMMTFAADEQGRIYYEDYAYRLATDGRAL